MVCRAMFTQSSALMGSGSTSGSTSCKCIVFFEILSGQLSQGFFGVGQVVAGHNRPGSCIVVTGAGFVHVGDGCQAHLEALFRLFELTLEMLFPPLLRK